MKKLLILVIFLTSLGAEVSQELKDNFKVQVKKLENLEKKYENFDSMTDTEKKAYTKEMLGLVPSELIELYTNKDKDELLEFIKYYSPLINYKAYFLIDKLYKDNNSLQLGKNLAYINYQANPLNIAYLDTYLWGMVRDNNLELALAGFKIILMQVKNETIQKHHDFTLKQLAFNYKKAIENIKNIIKNQYYTKLIFDKKLLFKDLDTIKTNDKDQFRKEANIIFAKHLDSQVVVLKQDNSIESIVERKKINRLKYNIENEVLYLNPNLMSLTIHSELKNVIKNNKYKKIVLNLRGNNGGALISVKDIISSFLPNKQKVILYIKTGEIGREMISIRKGKSLDINSPIEILIDKNTTRGAMYIASVLSKEKRVKVIGDYTKIDNSINRVVSLSKKSDLILKFQEGYTLDDEQNELKIWKD